ncbi:MAG TPA: hypothetical protein VFE46_15115 [Pirellulales bacterium]|jgi:hypothetical protein|nr:hypothetical protein [Pirellulales bacterium]
MATAAIQPAPADTLPVIASDLPKTAAKKPSADIFTADLFPGEQHESELPQSPMLFDSVSSPRSAQAAIQELPADLPNLHLTPAGVDQVLLASGDYRSHHLHVPCETAPARDEVLAEELPSHVLPKWSQV